MTPEKALNIVAGMCSKKEYCTTDIQEKLRGWEIPETEIHKIMVFLTDHQFIDDLRFARAYAEDKFRFNHWGKQKITMMLKQKKIAPEVIASALTVLGEEDYGQACLLLLQQKRRTLTEHDPYKLKAKLFRFGLSRGFDAGLVSQCLSQILDAGEGEEE